jgi:lysozyme
MASVIRRAWCRENHHRAAGGGNFITNVLRVKPRWRGVSVSVPQYVYDALVSLAFNVGTGNACSSTMVKFINQKRWRDACYQLPRWVYVKGIFNQGLENRRGRERPGA